MVVSYPVIAGVAVAAAAFLYVVYINPNMVSIFRPLNTSQKSSTVWDYGSKVSLTIASRNL